MELWPRFSGCRALRVLELVCWPASGQSWGLGGPGASARLLVGEACLGASASLMVGRARSLQMAVDMQGIPGLVPVHWCVGLDPRPFGGQGCVPG